MPSGVCDTSGGEKTVKIVSGSGSTTVDGVGVEDCPLLLFVILVCFIANNLIRNCCSRKESPATDGPEVEVGDRVSCVEVPSSLGEGILPRRFVISGVVLGYLSEGGDPVGVRFGLVVSGEGDRRQEDDVLVNDTDGEGETGEDEGVCSDLPWSPLVIGFTGLDRSLRS